MTATGRLPGTELTVGTLHAAYRDGETTPLDIASRIIEREATIDHSGYVAVESGRATTAAAAATERWSAGKPLGPLDGIPYARKDMFFRAGCPSDCGTSVYAGTIPDTTATLLARLDAAGAVDTGRLHMSELAMSPMGRNDQIGPGRNPWDPDRVSGGSSSGSGMAVAHGLATFALGSDTGGSVRIPAAACGITGLKPTQGLLSQAGMMPLSPSLDCAGVLARTSADIGVVMDVIAGIDAADSASRPADPNGYVIRGDANADGVVLVVPALEVGPLATSEVIAAVEDVVAALKSSGADVRRTPEFDVITGERLSSIITMTEGATSHLRALSRTAAPVLGEEVRRRLHKALGYPAVSFATALRLREHLLRDFLGLQLPEGCVMVIPTLPHEAPRIADTRAGTAAEIEEKFGLFSRWTRAINYLGLPGLSIPAGFGPAGMPLGVQLVGRPFTERLLLRLGHVYQQRTDWHMRIPGRA